MPILLPDGIIANSANPFLVEFGGVMNPFLGGPAQLINRLGLRYGVRVTIPPTFYANKGMALVSRLQRAKTDRLLMEWYQPGFVLGTAGNPLVASPVDGGTTLPMKGLPANKQFYEGQCFSVVSGSRFTHSFASDQQASVGGTLNASIWPPIRKDFLTNQVIELVPKIEGLVSPGEELNWQLSIERFVDVSFSIVESD